MNGIHAEALPKLLGLTQDMDVELWLIDGEEYIILELWIKECLRSKGSNIEVELDTEVVENDSLVEEMGVGPSCWGSSSWGVVGM